MTRRVLIVEEEESLRQELAHWLHGDGCDVAMIGEIGPKAIQLAGASHAVLCGLRVSGESGLRLMEQVRGVPFVFLLGPEHRDDDAALLHAGAFGILSLPVRPHHLLHMVRHATQLREMREAVQHARLELEARYSFTKLRGRSEPMARLLDRVRLVSNTRATVLLEGENGTEKEQIARVLHHNSERASGPFVPFHCEALSPELCEAELFGEERPARGFRRLGKVLLASGGTLFLEEVGSLPPAIQSQLLSMLETRRIVPVGGTREWEVDARVIATSSRDLLPLVQEGKFREDLYHALATIHLAIPPLRDRPEDVGILVRTIVEEIAAENRRPVPEFTSEALAHLEAYDWPGNVRQLRSYVERMMLLTQEVVLEVENLPDSIRRTTVRRTQSMPLAGMTMAEIERVAIRQTLEKTGGNRTQTARLLGIGLRTLHRKMGQYDLR